MPLSPIKPTEETPVAPPRALRLPLDPVLTLAVLGLGICSAVTLAAATRNLVPGRPNYYVDRQLTYLIVGFVLMLGLSRLDYARLRGTKNVIYGALILSILAVLALGHAARGSTRAINFPFFSFQASELGKVLLVVALAAFVGERSRKLRDRDTTVRVMIAALIPAMLVIVQPDLGSGMVYMVIAYVLLFVAGASWRHLGGLAALVAVSAAFVLVAAPAAGVHVLKPYQVARLTAFLHPSSNPQKEGYQQQESKIAIGAGQKTGRGVNASQIPNGFVPESHTDFVFAAVGEQYGFVGAGLVLLLYGLLISRAQRVLVMSKDLFGSLIAAGEAAMMMF
ncbi:MAG: rodA, partial [Solirubrobacterales bacterium]|nr:rodA [Solirubrobacterales bacterium]